MDYRKVFIGKILGEYLNPKNVLKVFYKPQRIPNAIKNFYVQTKTYYSDVKFKPQSPEYINSTYKHSIKGLSVLAAEKSNKKLPIETLTEVLDTSVFNSSFSIKIGDLFKQYGSDKSTTHNYYLIYSSVLEKNEDKSINILEVGLGTNNIDVLSNMGVEGKPGASLRAFRDACRQANVYGADIDKRILFTEERIKTYFLDQTQPDTFTSLKTELNNIKFDLIIDDGLHNSEANINTLNFALEMLKDDGMFIIEDINKDDYDFYQIISALLKDEYTLRLIETKSALLCMIRRK
jgi:hypothetical protein